MLKKRNLILVVSITLILVIAGCVNIGGPQTVKVAVSLPLGLQVGEKPTREDVLAAMTEFGEFSGVLGNWHFDANGDISLTRISGMQIQDSTWSFVQVLQ